MALPRENGHFPGQTEAGLMPRPPRVPAPHSTSPTPSPLVVLLTPPAARRDRDLSLALWLTKGRVHAGGAWRESRGIVGNGFPVAILSTAEPFSSPILLPLPTMCCLLLSPPGGRLFVLYQSPRDDVTKTKRRHCPGQ